MDGLLRALRAPRGGPRSGRPSLLARLVAGLVVLGLLAVTAPLVAGAVGPALRWLADALL